jgi:hypothetical protein
MAAQDRQQLRSDLAASGSTNLLDVAGDERDLNGLIGEIADFAGT